MELGKPASWPSTAYFESIKKNINLCMKIRFLETLKLEQKSWSKFFYQIIYHYN